MRRIAKGKSPLEMQRVSFQNISHSTSLDLEELHLIFQFESLMMKERFRLDL